MWVLLVVSLLTMPDTRMQHGTVSPVVAMQEFGDQKACMNARLALMKINSSINGTCVPKDSK